MDDETYMKKVMDAPIINFAACFLMILFYWLFMCCHNVHCLCKCCSPCSNKKSWGGKRCGQFMLVLCYLLVIAAAMSSWNARMHFHDAAEDITSVLNDTASVFKALEAEGDAMEAQAARITAVLAKDVDTYANGLCKETSQTEALNVSATKFAETVTEANKNFDGLGDKMQNIADDLDGSAKIVVDVVIISVTSGFIFISLLAIVGVCCGSRTLLGCADFFGVLVLIYMAVLTSAVLLSAIIFADFCVINGGPEGNLQVTVDHKDVDISGRNREFFDYYVTCTGTNPADADIADASDMMKVLAMRTRTLGEDVAQCDATQMSNIWSPVSGVSEQTRQSLAAIKGNLHCNKITPLLVQVTHDAVCTSMVSGLTDLWHSLVAAFVLLFFTLIYEAFVREWFRSSWCPCLCGGDPKEDRAKDQEMVGAPVASQPGQGQATVYDTGYEDAV